MDELESYLASVIKSKGYKTALYIGCAVGRRIPFFRSLLKVTGLDISSVYIKRAKRSFPLVDFVVADIRKYKSKVKYDVIISHGCLIHISHEDIKRTISNIFKLSKEAIFVESSGVEFNDPKNILVYEPKKYWQNRANHIDDKDDRNDLPMQYYYSHDYEGIFESLGIKYQIIKTFDENTKTRMFYCWIK